MHYAAVAFLGSLERLVREIERAAVVRLEDEESHGHRRVGLLEFCVFSCEKLRKGDEVAE